jgi:aminopeptidase N
MTAEFLRSAVRVCAAALLLLLWAAPALRAQNSGNFDVTAYTIDAQLFPATNMLSANVKIDFVPQTSLQSAGFELNSALRVGKVTDVSGQDLEFQQNGLNLQISFPNPLPAAAPASVTVAYRGSLASAEGSPIEGLKLASVSSDETYLLYLGRWFPVKRPGLDRFAATVHVTVPADETVVASGTSPMPSEQAGTKTYTFEYPGDSFPGTVVAGSFVTQSVGNVTVYAQPSHKDMAKNYAEAAEKILEFYSNQFGSLPGGGFNLVEIPDGTVNGYSTPGLVTLASRFFTDPVSERQLASQIAYQWWGCLVSPATPDDAFLQDGLATYSSALYVKESEGQSAFEELMHQISIGALTHEEVAPITQASSLHPYTPEYDSIVYQKGAMVFHMLQWVIGDKAFFETLRSMAEQYGGKTITANDFQKLAEKASDQKLTYFFAQWVSSTGVPQFKQSWAIYRVGDHYQVVGKIQQDLDIFRMPVDIRVFPEGRRPIDDRIMMEGTTADFTVNTLTQPQRVEIDPASNILKLDDKIKIQVELARGDQLREQQDYLEAVKQYQKVLAIDKNDSLAYYWLGQIYFTLRNYNAAAEEMRAALDGNLQPKWVEVWAHLTLGKIFDVTGQRDRAVNEYQKALHTGDNTQGALDQANRYIQKAYTGESQTAGLAAQ